MAEELKKVETVNKYDPTPWSNGASPAIDADHLNKIEKGVSEVTVATNNSIGAVNALNENVKSLNTNLTALNTTVSDNNTKVNEKIDSLTFETIYNQTKDTIVFDGGEETDN